MPELKEESGLQVPSCFAGVAGTLASSEATSCCGDGPDAAAAAAGEGQDRLACLPAPSLAAAISKVPASCCVAFPFFHSMHRFVARKRCVA